MFLNLGPELSITPVNIAMFKVPLLDIPALTCTESGCFGFGFNMEGSLGRLSCFVKNLLHRTVLLSVNIQSLNSSLCTNMSVQ